MSIVLRVVLVVLACAGTAALCELPRAFRGPLPAEILSFVPGPALNAEDLALLELLSWGRHWLWWIVPVAVLAAGLLAALLVASLRALRTGAGSFGMIAAAALATGTTSLVAQAGWLRDAPVPQYLGHGAVVLLCAVLAPLLRDRGLISLTAVSIALGVVVVPARRLAFAEAREAERFATLRTAVIASGFERLFVSFGADVPLAFRQAVAVSLRRPWQQSPVDLVSVPRGSDEEQLLLEAGWRGLAWNGARAQPVAPGEPAPGQTEAARLEVSARITADLGPVAVVTPAEGRYLLRVVTPAGVVRRAAADPAHGIRLLDGELEQFRTLTRPLPAESPVLVRVDSRVPPAASAWVTLRLPAAR